MEASQLISRLAFITLAHTLAGSPALANTDECQPRVIFDAASAKQHRPSYPAEARKQRMQGKGVWLVGVRSDGSIDSLTLAQSTGHALLDDSGSQAIKQWTFSPTDQKQCPEVRQTTFSLTWSLEQ